MQNHMHKSHNVYKQLARCKVDILYLHVVIKIIWQMYEKVSFLVDNGMLLPQLYLVKSYGFGVLCVNYISCVKGAMKH